MKNFDPRIEYLTIELAVPYDHHYSKIPMPEMEGWSRCYSEYRNAHELTLVYETQDLRQNPYDLMQVVKQYFNNLTELEQCQA